MLEQYSPRSTCEEKRMILLDCALVSMIVEILHVLLQNSDSNPQFAFPDCLVIFINNHCIGNGTVIVDENCAYEVHANDHCTDSVCFDVFDSGHFRECPE